MLRKRFEPSCVLLRLSQFGANHQQENVLVKLAYQCAKFLCRLSIDPRFWDLNFDKLAR
ncbi:Uncharacterised protein [Vibrio cholerae]|nr:Uncharacterised protein [Vibrio cholerae]